MVPVAILVALSLTAVGGSGLGGLGALSQVVSGPRVAGSDVTVDDGGSEIAEAVTQLAASSPGGPGATTGPGSAPGTGGGGEVPAGRAPFPGGGGDGPGGGDIDGTTPPGGGGGGGGGGPGPPEPPEPGVVEGVGQTVKDVTAGTPVAPTVEDAVDGLVEVCGRLGCP